VIMSWASVTTLSSVMLLFGPVDFTRPHGETLGEIQTSVPLFVL
jgi:hypothetical protein